MSPRASTLSLVLLALLVGGCTGGGSSVVRYDPYHPVESSLVTLSVDGDYGLFTPGKSTPLPPGLFSLRKGDQIGFLRRMGLLIAVAGSSEFVIEWNLPWTWQRVQAYSNQPARNLQDMP